MYKYYVIISLIAKFFEKLFYADSQKYLLNNIAYIMIMITGFYINYILFTYI